MTASTQSKNSLIAELYEFKVDKTNETLIEFTNRTVIAFKESGFDKIDLELPEPDVSDVCHNKTDQLMIEYDAFTSEL